MLVPYRSLFNIKIIFMKQWLICLLILISFSSSAQNIDSAWIRNNYTKKEIYITMRDGVRLFTAVYMPKSTVDKHPVLMTRTPYSCEPYGENNFAYFWYIYQKEYFK